jgi:hypothetical protein
VLFTLELADYYYGTSFEYLNTFLADERSQVITVRRPFKASTPDGHL